MGNLAYVCISDLHLGAPTALFTDTPPAKGVDPIAEQLRKTFAAALTKTMASIGPTGAASSQPGLVLLGDIFDFSLGTPKSSIDDFIAFLKAFKSSSGRVAFSKVIFVPGNHDHELWTATRLQRMVGTDDTRNNYVHTTPAFAATDTQPPAALIDQILRDNGFPGATTFYPNMGLASADKKKAVVLHHGHFIESLYTAMSTLTAALNGTSDLHPSVEELEKLNGSWIDFVWSTDGDDGPLGADVRLGYDYMMTGREDIRLDHRLARGLAKILIARLPIPTTAQARQLAEILTMAAVDSTLGQYGQMERLSYFEKLGSAGRAGLASYLSGPVRLQIEDELGTAPDSGTGTRSPVVKDLTFIFGHTHKPFEHRTIAKGFALPPAVYNTGGWDLDMPMFGTKLGAAAVFIDDDLNVASLRLCHVPHEDYGDAGSVKVRTADGTLAGNDLAVRLKNAIESDGVQPAWAAFSATAASAYKAKQAYVIAELRAEDKARRKSGGVL